MSRAARRPAADGEGRSAREFLPSRLTLAALREAAAGCRGCDLYRRGTQTVFGAGARSAAVMLVGEQPGDEEDRSGLPFVGPAGRLLDRALGDAGIGRAETWVTNAVKHFKWVARGKRRIHEKPGRRETRACRPWLEAEIQVVRPRVIVCLGATAAQSLLGAEFRLTEHRGEPLRTPWAPWLVATIHPSLVLRTPDDAGRRRVYGELVDDLRAARGLLAGEDAASPPP